MGKINIFDSIKVSLDKRRQKENEKLKSMSIKARSKYRKKKQRNKLIVLVAIIIVFILIIVFSVIAGVKKREAKRLAEELAMQEAQILPPADARITAVGDIIANSQFFKSSNYIKGDSFDFSPIFKYVKDIYEAGDFATITPEFACVDSYYTGYPMYRTPDQFMTAFAENGIDMCLLANNHIFDAGAENISRNMDVVEQNGMKCTGTRRSTDQKRYTIQDINGIKVGILDYVFQTGEHAINGIDLSPEDMLLINAFDQENPDSFYNEVEELLNAMKEGGAEYYICYLHWGIEYITSQMDYQSTIAQNLCNMGVDALIGSHPHVIQPVKLVTSTDGSHKMVCCYSIGNQLSNQRTELLPKAGGCTEDGLIVNLDIHRGDNNDISLKNIEFIPVWVYCNDEEVDEYKHSEGYRKKDPGIEKYYILPLNDRDGILSKTNDELGDLSEQIDASLQRTNAIINDGVNEIRRALPIKK